MGDDLARKRFSCFVIGEGDLPLACAEHLRRAEKGVRAFITGDEQTRRVALSLGLEVLPPREGLAAVRAGDPFDFLFSIINPKILPGDVLAAARRLSINYHNALLPRYAGVHATTWALLNREPAVGVTWHVMVEEADAGDILKQVEVAVLPHDTAKTLNAKCGNAAYEAFVELVEELAEGRESRQGQDLSRRTYFSLWQRPATAGWLDWRRPAAELDALIRGLSFGETDNELVSAKFATATGYLVPERSELVAALPAEAPGTITEVADGAVQVACGEGAVRLLGFRDLAGRRLAEAELRDQHALGAGARLPLPDGAALERAGSLAASVARHERFWARRLAELVPIHLPWTRRSRCAESPCWRTARVSLGGGGRRRRDQVGAVALVYLARVAGVWRFDVDYSDAELEAEVRGIEDLFALSVPARIELDSEATFAAAVTAMRGLEEARARRTYSLDMLNRRRLLRDRGVTRACPVALRLGDDARPTPGNELLVHVDAHSNLSLLYDARVFGDETIARAAAGMAALGAAALSESGGEEPISRLPLLPAEERSRLLARGDGARRSFARPVLVHKLVEAAVDRNPDATALRSERAELSYRDLDARANQLARHFLGAGAGQERPIAVCLEPSFDLAVSLLGALKAGAPFVPIDPGDPPDRVRAVVEESGACLFVGHSDSAPRFSESRVEFLMLDAAPDLAGHDPTRPQVELRGYDLACIRLLPRRGRVKGSIGSHEGLANVLAWTQELFGLKEDDVVLWQSSLALDASLWELFAPLAAGSQAIVTSLADSRDPGRVVGLMEKFGITFVHFVPSLLDAALDVPAAKGAWRSVRRVLCSGEALPGRVRDRFSSSSSGTLFNLYGSAEAGPFASVWRCGPDGEGDVIPIGHPPPNVSLYVLDDNLQPAPTEVPGELYVGGVQLARGYLGDPALTAESFIPSPHGASGERLFRTGDRARTRPDGAIELLGRLDRRITVEGAPVDLDEIERALSAHPAVTRCAISPGPWNGRAQLVAFVVLAAGQALDPDEARRYLRRSLPDWAVPAAVVFLDSLPLTSSGEVDREALPEPGEESFDREGYVAPRTPEEDALVAIFVETLGLERIGIHDDFFALGGNSILATRVVSRVRERLAVQLPLRSLFETPTIEALAQTLEKRREAAERREVERAVLKEAEAEIAGWITGLEAEELHARLTTWRKVELTPHQASAPAEADGARAELLARLLAQHQIDARPSAPLARYSGPDVPATFTQEMQWDFHERGNFRPLGVHAVAFRLRGRLDLEAMERAVASLVERQEALRTTFACSDGRLSQLVGEGGPSLRVHDLRRQGAGERRAEARELFKEVSRPHDLRAEVFRAHLVRLEDEEHLLMMAPHHIIVDGFSWGVLQDDLAAFYEAYARGGEAALPQLKWRSRDFCFWQRTLEERPVGREQLVFWERLMQGYEGLELPGDGRTSVRRTVGLATDTYPVDLIPFVLEGPRWQATQALSARLSCTPYVVLATGFLLLLCRWAGRYDVCTNSGQFHRTRPGSESAIGNFVTPYPLRITFDGAWTLEAAVQQVREVVIATREHAQVAPISALHHIVEWSRYNFNYLLREAWPLKFPGAEIEILDWSVYEPRTTHDLALFVRQTERGVLGAFHSNAERFSRELIERAGSRLLSVLETMALAPNTRVRDLPPAV